MADLLTPSGLARFTAVAEAADGGWGFCQAVTTTGPRAGAFGWAGGLGTTWLVDPGRDLVVVVLTQRLFDSAGPPAVHGDLQEAAYDACG